MSNVARVAGQAANTLSKPLNVEEVFSTYLYDGNGSTQTITNGIDLDGEGGLVWIKSRTGTSDHWLSDSERAYTTRFLRTNRTNAESNNDSSVTSYSADGFSVGGAFHVNTNNQDYASWTFRKAPKFFDVQTFTYSSGSATTINHSLNCEVGMVIIKRTDSSDNWYVQHRSNTGSDSTGILNGTAAFNSPNGYSNWIATFGTTSLTTVTNQVSGTYVAYLFAHNDGDGGFGPDGDADIIKCGSYTGNGSTNGPEIDLGFEPQFVMIKGTQYSDATGVDYRHWYMYDMMRGNTVHDGSTYESKALKANESTNESGTNFNPQPTPTGFKLGANRAATNYNGETYIYIAIRRPTAVPTSATDVFDVNQTTSNQSVTTGFPVDLQLGQYTGGGATYVVDRMRGMSTSTTGSMKYLQTQTTGAEASNTGSLGFNGFVQNGFSHTLGNYEQALWSWKRAPNFCDIVAYSGNGTLGRTVSHNLGVAPEMMWIKDRDDATDAWRVYHSGLPTPKDDFLKLNTTSAAESQVEQWNSTEPTSTEFSVSGQGRSTNDAGEDYIAYLFASLDGISKVGSVSHTTGSNTDVDCGFSAGARFVILKGTHASGWQVFDTERGIVAGNDATLTLHSTSAEDSSQDRIDPYSSGFSIGPDLATGTFIYYAIA